MDWRRQGAALLAGGASVLAYAPFGIFPLAFVSLGLLFWLLGPGMPRRLAAAAQKTRVGYGFGVGFA